MSAQTRLASQPAIGLPAVDDPGLDLQFVRGKPLNAKAVKEPRSVGRDIRRLIGPVIKVVVAEQANIGNENSGINIEPVIYVKVIAAVSLRYIFVGATKVPLAASGARVIARCCNTEHSVHG